MYQTQFLRNRPILVLKAGFGTILSLMIAMVSFNLFEIYSQHLSLESLVDYHSVRIQKAQKLRNLMRDRMVMIGIMVMEDDVFEREEVYERYVAGGQDYLTARATVEDMAKTVEEQEQAKALRDTNTDLTPINSQVVALARQDRREAARRLYLGSAHPKQRQALHQVDAMIEAYTTAAKRVEEEAHLQANWVLLLTGIMSVLTIIGGLLIAAFAVRRVKQDRKALIEGHRRERVLQHRTTHDSLTGLLNRDGMKEYLAEVISAGRAQQRPFAMLLLDLDGFKQINDNHSHGAGDRLLIQVADRLRQCVLDEDGAAIRLAGDEFVVVSQRAQTAAAAATLANNILQAVGRPYEVGAQEHIVTVSIGVALYPDDADNTSALLHCADVAMYRAKSAGKNRFQRYFPEFANDKTRHRDVRHKAGS